MEHSILPYNPFKKTNLESTMTHSVGLGERILETFLKISIITLMVLLTGSILNSCSGSTIEVNG